MKVLQFDTCCKAIGENFNCGFLQKKHTTVPHLLWRFCSKNVFHCYEYHLDSLLMNFTCVKMPGPLKFI